MRLWHIDLLPYLPKMQHRGQHRECCALRGMGWGKPHSVVDYVFKYSYSMLFYYHQKVIEVLEREQICRIDPVWKDPQYRGIKLGYDKTEFTMLKDNQNYPEHDSEYLKECLENLRRKDITITLS